jgi:DNA-binding MarR family transcriptional regulator
MSEQHYRADDYRAVDSIGHLIRRVYTVMLGRAEAVFGEQGFTLMQWIVLLYLRDGLARTASEIAREFSHDSGALTRVIDRLEERGLVSRQRSERDRRVVELELTAEGRRTIDALLPMVVEQMNTALAPFNHEEFLRFRSFLTRLLDHLVSMTPAEPAQPLTPQGATGRKRPSSESRPRKRQ